MEVADTAVDSVFDHLRADSAELAGEVMQYEDVCRYCSIPDPESIINDLVEALR